MRNFEVFSRSGLHLVLLIIIVSACTLGYAGSTNSQPIQNTNHPNSDIPQIAKFTATQDVIIQSVITTTVQAEDASPAQSPATVFIPMIEIPPKDVVWEMLGQVDIDRALNDLRQLTGEAPICIENECQTITNRMTGRQGLRWAKRHVYKELMDLGYSVEFQDWSRSGYADQNLIARKPGMQHPEEEIYFVAHIDGVNSPAADDNASGVVDLLVLARILSRYSFSRSVVMLFSTGEEQGTLGVKSYLDKLTSIELSAIKYVINIDMVGYDANDDGVMELWHGNHAPSIALTQTMSETIQAYQMDLSPGLVVGCG